MNPTVTLPGFRLPVPVAVWRSLATASLSGFLIIRLLPIICLPASSRFHCPADYSPCSGPATTTTTSSTSPLPVICPRDTRDRVCVCVSYPPRHTHLFPIPTSTVQDLWIPQSLCPCTPYLWTIIFSCAKGNFLRHISLVEGLGGTKIGAAHIHYNVRSLRPEGTLFNWSEPFA